MEKHMENLNSTLPTMKQLKAVIKPFAQANTRKAIWQLINSVVPYLLLWAAMIWSIRFSYWLTLGLAFFAAFFMMRIFILFHDCGHNSLFPSIKWNRIVGFVLGVMTFTPSEQWWRSHAIHHATSGNLDKRGTGDVITWTVDEYLSKPWIAKIGYRAFRNPLVMFLLGPIWIFLIANRIPKLKLGKRETRFQWWHNLALLLVIVTMSLTIGLRNYILIQLPVIWLGGLVGIWLFFVQHQYEGVYWRRSDKWDYVASALQGASYYELPKILQWFSGNIGFHSIHHLSPAIPNYNLAKCYQSDEILRDYSKTIRFFEGLRSIGLDLIDEKSGRLVRFSEVKKITEMAGKPLRV
ncbi:MAG: fatty acid desaturase [Chloroflexi bacterium 44-23]|nr:MAG: fatty acid desaturase [Chloroflexi bacterium 44-23]